MSANNTYLAVFLGSKNSPRRAAWDALSESVRNARQQEGIAAWRAWLGKTSRVHRHPGRPAG